MDHRIISPFCGPTALHLFQPANVNFSRGREPTFRPAVEYLVFFSSRWHFGGSCRGFTADEWNRGPTDTARLGSFGTWASWPSQNKWLMGSLVAAPTRWAPNQSKKWSYGFGATLRSQKKSRELEDEEMSPLWGFKRPYFQEWNLLNWVNWGYNLLKQLTATQVGALLTQESGFATEAPGAIWEGGMMEDMWFISPENLHVHFKRNIVFQPSFFQGQAVSFWGV